MPIRFLVCFVVLTSLLAMGCGKDRTPDLPDDPPTHDESVLNALAPYDPVYKLNHNGRVVRLRLEGRRIPASVLDEVSKFTELTDLSLYAALVTDESLARLQTLTQLHSLGLGATPITEKGLVHLERLSSLQHMWLSKPVTMSKGAENLRAALPNLTIHAQ